MSKKSGFRSIRGRIVETTLGDRQAGAEVPARRGAARGPRLLDNCNSAGTFLARTYQARYGVTLSLPSVIAARGVAEVLSPTLEAEESAALEASAKAFRQALEGVSQLLV